MWEHKEQYLKYEDPVNISIIRYFNTHTNVESSTVTLNCGFCKKLQS